MCGWSMVIMSVYVWPIVINNVADTWS